MADGLKIGAWRTSEQDLQDIRLRVPAPCGARHLQTQMRVATSSRVPERLNPNRFSDPLNKPGLMRSSLGLLQVSRPQKAHSWYLDNGLSWRLTSPGLAREESYSLFGDASKQHQSAVTLNYDAYPSSTISRRAATAAQGHIFNTWERCRRGIFTPSHQSGGSLKVSHGMRSPLGLSPGSSSQRLSPRSSPRGQRGSFGLQQRLSPNTRTPDTSPGPSLRSSYVSQWADNSSSHSSPFASSAHTASSSREGTDTSYGSETDDDFFYVSCQQLSRGLADLSFRQQDRSPRHEQFLRQPQPSPRGHVLENPTFCSPAQSYSFEDDDVFHDFSDDALSDDVFLDNPDPPVSVERVSPRSAGSASPRFGQKGEYKKEADKNLNDADAQALESLRRNSLQNKRRQLWQNRRSRTSARRPKQRSFSGDSSSSSRLHSHVTSSKSPLSSASSPAKTDSNLEVRRSSSGAQGSKSPSAYDSDGRRNFHYVISPTDDLEMPEVIAVRKSSVELIKWQNSLRRRRRRQAKRHDLGRSNKKRESAPVAAALSTM